MMIRPLMPGAAPLLIWAWALAMQASAFAAPTTNATMTAVAADGSTPSPAPAAPPEIQATLPKARLVGKGTLRFFGLRVYEASLWAPPGFRAASYDNQPFALQIEYARKLHGTAIAERSVAEMRRVGAFTEEQSRSWLAFMTQAFPDVGANDRLVGLHDGKGGVRFLYNGKPTAETTDRAFARLFFGIWLDPHTSAPALRQELIGEPR